jgi:hypothetical protein
MVDDTEPIRLFSPKTARALWITAIAIGGLTLALNVWAWAGRGYAWTIFLGPVGLLLLLVSYPLVRSRQRLYLALQALAAGLLVADLVLIVKHL